VTYKNYRYPKWAECIGWFVALSSILAIPIYAIVLFLRQKGSLKEVFTQIFPMVDVDNLLFSISVGKKSHYQRLLNANHQLMMVLIANNICSLI
jgi:hypothetical protein